MLAFIDQRSKYYDRFKLNTESTKINHLNSQKNLKCTKIQIAKTGKEIANRQAKTIFVRDATGKAR